jgi:ATP-dependent Lon protease
LDKISDTSKGEEIIHMLTHITDPSQNTLFQDNYFPGVNVDLSKALFIFSYNDESKVNSILRDRMYVIHTKGFNIEDKLKICNDYLLPDIYDTFAFTSSEIVFSDEIVKMIIKDYTGEEEGVRNLKRCIETIISKINIHVLSDGDDDLSFKLNEFTLPVNLTKDHIEILLKEGSKETKTPFGMYC